jgi:hypothetical protein
MAIITIINNGVEHSKFQANLGYLVRFCLSLPLKKGQSTNGGEHHLLYTPLVGM